MCQLSPAVTFVCAPVVGIDSFGVTIGGDANPLEGGSWNGEGSGGLLSVLNSGRSLITLGASVRQVRTINDSTLGTGVLSARVQHWVGRGTVLSGGFVGVAAERRIATSSSLLPQQRPMSLPSPRTSTARNS